MAVTAPPTINALPAPPDPNNRATYNTLAYPWSVALGPYSAQLNAVAANVYANATDAAASAANSAAQATIATAKASQTAADASATSADRVQTGLDRAAAAASAASAAAIAGAFVGTSDSSLNIGAGSKTFITQAGEQYSAGIWMTAVSRANPANWMFGEVTSYIGTTLVIDVQTVGGSGTCADWNLSLSGPRGAQGPQGIPGVLAGVATGAVDLLTGAALASAATINLDAATGNRVHITGTNPITAVTLTRGPRTVIFDGVLTLTHHATNNNLPGGVNIITAPGDRAVYESDGVTVYCVSYIKANGLPVAGVSASLIRSARTANASLGVADKGALIDITSGTFTQTFGAVATLGAGWFCYIRNSGAGDITLDPSGTELIDGLTSYIMYPGEVRLIQCDGTAFYSVILQSFTKTFTNTANFIKPPGYFAFDTFGLGGGGGGGGGSSVAGGRGGGGGAGAGAIRALILASALAASTLVTIGGGGAGGAQDAIGSVGGTTSVGMLLVAKGGAGGGAGTAYGNTISGAYGGGTYTVNAAPTGFLSSTAGGYYPEYGGASVSNQTSGNNSPCTAGDGSLVGGAAGGTGQYSSYQGGPGGISRVPATLSGGGGIGGLNAQGQDMVGTFAAGGGGSGAFRGGHGGYGCGGGGGGCTAGAGAAGGNGGGGLVTISGVK
ncbi:hypothetical protein GTP44_00970 [Duganella sp. FT50W]|uniref:Uncharacterized protein n=1 Tax=Duganella lactea TaxID=2692173 RepID=A0A6L8MEF3_9BURK|nr:hypothetical protein [Duganella lactea]MYM80531.1 hypothetical protein [Duganella lactea]